MFNYKTYIFRAGSLNYVNRIKKIETFLLNVLSNNAHLSAMNEVV